MVHTEIHALKLIVAIKRRYESGTNRGVGKQALASPAIMVFARKLYASYYECILIKGNKYNTINVN